LKVRFLVTPVGLMMGNVKAAGRLMKALAGEGVDVSDHIDAWDFDILHVHTPVPPQNIIIVKKAKRRGIRVIVHSHTTVEDAEGTFTGSSAFSGVVSKYLSYFYNLGDLVLSPSAWTKGTLERRGVVAPIKVLSNGIDLGRFRFDAERRMRFRERYGFAESEKVVYSIGVVCVKKGIASYPEVVNAVDGVKFVWVGQLSLLYQPLKVNRSMKRCGQRVRFLHDVGDIVDAHCGCDIFFMPSFAENQGIAVLEALAIGRPVVARDLEVYRGLLENGKSALLCRDGAEFAAAIGKIKSDDALAGNLVVGGKGALADHDMRKVVRELIAIYESLLAEKRGVRA